MKFQELVCLEQNPLDLELLLKYSSDLISEDETQKRENQYAKESKGCFMYFLEYENKALWQDV